MLLNMRKSMMRIWDNMGQLGIQENPIQEMRFPEHKLSCIIPDG